MHKTTAEEQGLPQGMEDDPFFKFFRGMPGFQQRGPAATRCRSKGLGSGFIISSDGLILTNAHVVREAKDVTVKLSDRREFTAKVLGSDMTTDIAVLRIKPPAAVWRLATRAMLRSATRARDRAPYVRADRDTRQS